VGRAGVGFGTAIDLDSDCVFRTVDVRALLESGEREGAPEDLTVAIGARPRDVDLMAHRGIATR